MSEPVVIFGASSYIGGYAIRALLDGGHRVIAVARRPKMASILLPESVEIEVVTAEDAIRSLGDSERSVVNFAFVKDSDPGRMYRANRVLMESVERVASGRCRRLIQISTEAVFGAQLSESTPPVRVTKTPSDLYGESKLHAEQLSESLARKLGAELAIVRLGNVIGPGSRNWVAGLAQRVLEVKPVGYTGSNGFSNATHVRNIGDYMVALIDGSAGALAAHGAYHHLAEFSDRRWPELLDVISDEVGFRWTTISRPPSVAKGGNPVKRALKSANRTGAGHYLRAGLGRIPDPRALEWFNSWVRSPAPPAVGPIDAVGAEDLGLLDVLSEEHRFSSHTLDGWSPPVDFGEACTEIAESLRESGFSTKPA